ncbi:unnamed protein product [Camellia sinensis]
MNHSCHPTSFSSLTPQSEFLGFGLASIVLPTTFLFISLSVSNQMAIKSILRSNQHHKAFYVLGLLNLVLLIQKGGAFEFTVGGSNGWKVPSDSSALYNKWAERNRFQIGDSLLFVYPADKDIVLQVNKDDYNNCNTAQPIQKFSDGHTSFKFNQSGHFYFISGLKDNCLKNEKLEVVVMADRTNRSSTTSPPPPPSPAPTEGSVENTPSPTPSAEQTPPPSAASSIVVNFVASIGAFLSGSLLLGF